MVCEDFSLPVCGLLGSLTSFSFFIRNEIRAMHIVCVVWTGVVSPAKLRMWLTWLNKIRWCGAHYTSCYIQIQERKDEMPHRNIGLELCSSVPILRCIPCVCVCVCVRLQPVAVCRASLSVHGTCPGCIQGSVRWNDPLNAPWGVEKPDQGHGCSRCRFGQFLQMFHPAVKHKLCFT